jgi:hypothetical protein
MAWAADTRAMSDPFPEAETTPSPERTAEGLNTLRLMLWLLVALVVGAGAVCRANNMARAHLFDPCDGNGEDRISTLLLDSFAEVKRTGGDMTSVRAVQRQILRLTPSFGEEPLGQGFFEVLCLSWSAAFPSGRPLRARVQGRL